ncbi:MAG TPA: hypothetical protein VMH81_00115 [Bryobacteraceae bacterium]|nr:hypothetical protein [Bryobacteraceae bacterium]
MDPIRLQFLGWLAVPFVVLAAIALADASLSALAGLRRRSPNVMNSNNR